MSEREELAKWCDKIVELYPGEERYRRLAALLRQPPAPAQVTGEVTIDLFYELSRHFPSLRARSYDEDLAAIKAFMQAALKAQRIGQEG
jgi:hypothetical protein